MATYVIENRGTEEAPFGFVYLDEDARAYFALVGNELRIGGPGSGYWEPFTQAQLHEAKRALIRHFKLVIA